jgi:hypothetical protein
VRGTDGRFGEIRYIPAATMVIVEPCGDGSIRVRCSPAVDVDTPLALHAMVPRKRRRVGRPMDVGTNSLHRRANAFAHHGRR